MKFINTVAIFAIVGSLLGVSAQDSGEEPVWYNFIVNDDLEAWAVIATYDPEFNEFYLWTPQDDVCLLTPDWKSDNKEDNIWGFFVSDTDEGNGCSFVMEMGWTYAVYTYDEETQDPVSIVGPFGNDWAFKDEVTFAAEYPSYSMQFSQMVAQDMGYQEEMTPVWYNFIVSEEIGTWAVIATYDEEF